MYTVWLIRGRAEVWNIGYQPEAGHRKVFESISYEKAWAFCKGYNDALAAR